ncbi:hypothetical protein GA0070616_2658 [Micromonospora nigra]|uniref:Uncharacterized protein n=1 Tax=Micromonospora nigra TaxID=145857 RepID=A0A1C6S101_9ACTN|nr:hypothetical protein [Micromonospora nigra]SCL23065.1 hypothetical protein GA0070616_2658 [Micromonospora nigra]
METHLAVLVPVAVVWWVAGWLADGLPRLDRARLLRRRTGWVLGLTLAGIGLTGAVFLAGLASAAVPADRAAAGLALAAAPAFVVAVCTVRRLRRVRAGAQAFAAVPRIPAPHGLRAAAAHPLVGLPVQVTGLAILPALATASGANLPTGPGVTGFAVTLGVLGVAAIGVRHALRHNRLAERAMPERPASARTAGALHV